MNIINFEVKHDTEPVHHFLLPNNIRCIIFGPSSCGKTNLMLNLLLTEGYLNYDKLYIYSKSVNQEKYQLLKQWSDSIAKTTHQDTVTFMTSQDEIMPVNKHDKNTRL